MAREAGLRATAAVRKLRPDSRRYGRAIDGGHGGELKQVETEKGAKLASQILDRIRKSGSVSQDTPLQKPPEIPSSIEVIPTEEAVAAHLEAAMLSGSAAAIVSAIAVRNALPYLRLGQRLKQAEEDTKIWGRRLEWCKARDKEASESLAEKRSAPGRVRIGDRQGSDYELRQIRARLGTTEKWATGVKQSVVALREAVTHMAAGNRERSEVFTRQCTVLTDGAADFWAAVERDEKNAGRSILL